MERGFLKDILRSGQTVFTTRDLQLMWGSIPLTRVYNRINYYLKQGDLHKIRRGMFARDKNYDRHEMASRIYAPSYISFETVLGQEGITFQFYSQLFVASSLTKEMVADGQKIQFLKLHKEILLNPLGVDFTSNYAQATPERAFLDRLYLSPEYHFDRLDLLNWEKVQSILPAYRGNKQLNFRVDRLRREWENS